MINMIINSFKFDNAYRKNAFIYRLRELPLIGKKIPSDLYNNYLLDVFIHLTVGIYNIVVPFIGKFIYLFFFLFIPMLYFENSNAFINIFVFLTIIGGAFNTFMFNPSKSKYYAVVLMRMNPKRYALGNFFVFCLKLLISFYPAVLFFGFIFDVNIVLLLLMPIFVIAVKLIGNSLFLKIYDKTRKVITENNLLLIGIISVIGLSFAYLLPYFGYSISSLVFILIFIISVVLSIISLFYIIKSNHYSKIYKKMLNINNVIFDAGEVNNTNRKKQYYSHIENNNITSNKTGYDYFNELFVRRHYKILTKSSIKIALVAAVIFLMVIAVSLIDKNILHDLKNIPLSSLPYFVFVMYFINRGSIITQAMFINCDHSMLAYRFFRQKEAILKLFVIRLKTLIKINMIPSLVIAVGLPILLFITGGTSNYLNYVLLFISIIFLSIFFSVHHMVVYYLLQPYDINMKAKSGIYSFVNGLTYFICYMCIDLKVPTIVFASGITLFSVGYILLSLLLVYKYAYKTFRLK